MIKVLIVDDETFASDNLAKLIHLYGEDLFVTGIADSVESAIDKIELFQPELVFLDVHLARDTSFSILNAFPDPSFSIIFISAYANYAIDAFKVNAIDYLLKPIDSDDLITAIGKYRTRKSLVEKDSTSNISIRVHHKDVVNFIPSSNIMALIADDNYTSILSGDGKKYTAAKTLKEFEEILKSDKLFIRIHRSIIINRRSIETYSKVQPYTITLKNGAMYEVSRRKRAEILAALTGN